MNIPGTLHDTADSGCSGAHNVLQLFTAENSNSDAIYQLFHYTKFIAKFFVSQIVAVCVIDSDGGNSFIL